MERKNWLLLAIAAAKEDGLDPVQLQKSLFLLGQRRKKDVGPNFYKFVPHNYGPFSTEIYTDSATLVSEGYIRRSRQPGYSWSVSRATDVGQRQARAIRPHAPQDGIAYLEVAVGWVKHLSFEDLIRSVYHHFPKYQVNSVFRD